MHAAAGKRQDWIGLWGVVTRLQWAKLLEATGLMCVRLIMTFAQPLLLERLLDELDSATPNLPLSFGLAGAMFLCGVLASVAVHGFWFAAQRAGIRMTSALTTEVFRKTLLLGPVARARFGIGQLVQLMSVDAERLSSNYVMPLVQWGSWPPVITLVVGVINLHRLLGWPALIAAALLTSMPFIAAFYISGKIREAQERVQTLRDERVRLAEETIRHIRALKSLGWEGPALARVLRARRREMAAVWTDLSWRVVSGAFVVMVPAVATALSFGLYSLVVGERMTASVIFASMAWMSTLQGPMWQIPMAIRSVVSASVSLDRLAKFLWASDEAKHALLLDEPDVPAPGAAARAPTLARGISADSSVASSGDESTGWHRRRGGKVKLSRVSVVWPEMPQTENAAVAAAESGEAGLRGACALWPCRCFRRLQRRTGAAARLGAVAVVCCCPPSCSRQQTRQGEPASARRSSSEDGSDEAPLTATDLTPGAAGTGAMRAGGSVNARGSGPGDAAAAPRAAATRVGAGPPAAAASGGGEGEAAQPRVVFATVVTGASLAAGPGLTVILGATGTGKSSLLSSLIGAPLTTGRIRARGTMSYAGQTPWLLNASVKDNITFVSPYREGWFNAVVAACGLTEDIASFSHGVHTAIGERGITISGGQKARVALARAVYADADIVLLDDPLAALDATVAASVLEECVMRALVLRGRTVIMTTNLHSLARDPRVAAVYLVEPDLGCPGGPARVRLVPRAQIASVRLDGGPADDRAANRTGIDGRPANGAAAACGAAVPAVVSSDGEGTSLAPVTALGLSRSDSAPPASTPLDLSEEELGEPQATALAPLVAPTPRREGPGTHGLLSPVLLSAEPQRAAVEDTNELFETDLAAYARLLSGKDDKPAEDGTGAESASKASGGRPVSGMMQEDESERGMIRFSVFLRYCRSCGPWAFAFVFAAAMVLREAALLSTDLFLTVWIDADSVTPSPSRPDAPPTGGLFNGGISFSWLCPKAEPGSTALGHRGDECYAVVYSVLTGMTVLLAVSMWCLTNVGSVSASRLLHLRLMRALLLTKQAFFDTTPVGLVLNRAVKDVQKIDLMVAPTVRSFVYNCLRLASSMLLVAAGSPWVLLSAALLALPYYAVALRFRHAARDLQRLSSSSNSPLLSLFSEAAHGANVARAFGAEQALLSRHRVLSMSYVTRQVLLMAVQQWATVWLEAFGNVIVLATAALLVVSRSYGLIPVSIVGFLLTQAQTVPSNLLWVTRNYASLELALIAAERVFQFSDLPDERQQFDAPEQSQPPRSRICSALCCSCGTTRDDDSAAYADLSGDARSMGRGKAGGGAAASALLAAHAREEAESAGPRPLPDPVGLPAWATAAEGAIASPGGAQGARLPRPRTASGSATRGRIEMQHLRLQYESAATPAIADLSVVFPAGAKVAIVGRSGAGKSSTIAAMLRTHYHTGRVLVDGADTKAMGPWQTRQCFATLQQDAVVLSGSVRQNLLGLQDALTRMTGISPTSWLLDASARAAGAAPADAGLPPHVAAAAGHRAPLPAATTMSLSARARSAAQVASLSSGLQREPSAHLQLRGMSASALREAGRSSGVAEARAKHGVVAEASRLDVICVEALRAVGLHDRLPDLDEHLVSADSLSRGQAQLLGLARCLVRLQLQGCPVLLADEATSSVDRDTDERVHDVILRLPHTVVSICHRLDHIARFDLVLVMGAGRLVEFAPPAELLARPDSALFSLVADYRSQRSKKRAG